MAEVKLTINGKQITAEKGQTILQAAKNNDIYIPTLCHFEGIEGRANCRICVVEVEGMRTFQPACVTKVSEGMAVNTDTEKIRAARKTTLELILSHHAVDCHHCMRIGSSSEQSLDPKFCEMCFWCDCVRDGFCELQSLAREYHVDVLPFIQHEKDYEEDTSLRSVIRNPNKCIKCRRCVDVCGEVQTVHNLSMANRGRKIMVVPELGKPMAESACVRCGHCVDICPVGAIYMEEHKDEVLYMAHAYDTDVVAQLSDDVLPELDKLYKLEPGTIRIGQVVSALHKIGIKNVVSDEHAAFLSAQQAAEIIEKKLGKEPVIITDSSAVMNFVDRYFPEIKGQISRYDSKQDVFCKLAEEFKGDKILKKVNVTNVKEAGAEARETGNVDYAINARELYRIFIRTGGAPARKYVSAFDKTWNDSSLPYAELLKNKDWNLEPDPEELAVLVDGKPVKCAVAHNLGQVRKLLEGDCKRYDIVRLMA
ncbi:MAG: (2Fe-2S)-binding protein [Mogibacterium sp.]|nr:(2Fe-2S)-binding protein [Mogibacterium sp.]